MNWLDWSVLIVYFFAMGGIGIWAMRRVKVQEDYFMGGRGFGKILQTFAAFGAGTGAADPVNTARTTVTSGMSGMWSIMSWLFVTPFYWITGVWYRRMRHMTLGDWYVERYESKALGAAYTIFGLIFYMFYLSMFFSAVGKVAAPLMGDTLMLGGWEAKLEYVLVPMIALVVIVYGVLGGLTAAYWTDLIQGIFIIVLSILLIPFGLTALSDQFGGSGMMDGFRIMHERLPDSMFTIVGSTRASDFPAYMIAAVALISLLGVAVQPHFIATGGGSAKSETDARVGLVTGNFFKRFCTIGWALTALIVVALYAGTEHLDDPDKAWGVASRELLGPGLRGLMLACLLAALMSSADCYMLVSSALVVRNIYAAYINPNASEQQYVRMGRLTGVIVIVGAVIVSLSIMDVFKQLQLTWVIPMALAPAFWIGMYWRRATKAATWGTIAYVTLFFFVIPWLVPAFAPGLKSNPSYAFATDQIVTITKRQASPTDVAVRKRAAERWQQDTEALTAALPSVQDAAMKAKMQARLDELQKSGRPADLDLGETFEERLSSGGTSVFWSAVKPVSADAKPTKVDEGDLNEHTQQITLRYDDGVALQGSGQFNLDLLLFHWCGMDLRTRSVAELRSLKLFTQIIAPFLVMIVLSLLTKRNSKEALDRFYVKMKTAVDPDREKDRKELEASYANPSRFDEKRLFPNSDWEFVKPKTFDVVGFIICFAACFAIIGFAMFLASIGG